ncbi:MAG: type III secretion system export apparatus subunit SctT [Desulfovibrio sp.]|nr:type III secretion system export apparatus subunit SctT [Desulfovibrio sp.]
MGIEDLLREFEVYRHLTAAVVGMPRIFVPCMIAPFFGSAVVSGQLRTALVFAIYLVAHPLVQSQMPADLPASAGEATFLGLLLIKEIFLGFILGWIAGIPFWAAQSGGFFIDNQRGASMAEGADALSGEQTSPTGILFLQGVIYFFFVSGAFLSFLGLVYSSYLVWPAASLFPGLNRAAAMLFAEQAGWLMLNMLLLAGPIVIACLLIDVSLGLVNRFASQLNVYILAMPIKSGVASFILLVYFGMFSANAPALYSHIRATLLRLQGLLP